MKKIKIPARYFVIRNDSGTVAIRGKGGRFTGRKGPDSSHSYKGPGDTTKARHLYRSIDLNHDGRIGPNEKGGTIHGRTISVKSSRRARGYEKRV